MSNFKDRCVATGLPKSILTEPLPLARFVTRLQGCVSTFITHNLSRKSNEPFPLKRVYPRHALPNDQRVDVVGTLIGFDRLQVGHVAEDGVLVGYAVGAEDVAG